MNTKVNKNTWPTIVALVLVALLGCGVVALGLKHDSKVTELTKQVSSVGQQNSELQQRVDEAESKAGQLESNNSSLQEENRRLQSENASIKAMKQQRLNNSGNSKICYLTFDDGPSANTLEILKILKSENAKATFFVIARSRTEYIKTIADEGHALAIHSYTHDYPTIYKSEAAYYNDLYKMQALIKDKTGKTVHLMRFPGGSSNKVSLKHCKGIMTKLTAGVQSKGFYYFDWNVDSGDANGTNVPAAKLVNNVLRESNGVKNICVLMHDAPAKKTTVQALPTIIKELKNRGYRFEALSEASPAFHHSHLNN